jgi:hypothetical protein
MKKKQILFPGFAIIFIMTIITIAGCKNEETVTFPSSFIGTWKRAYQSPYNNTLTFTATTLKASNQNITRTLQSVSGDFYTYTPSSLPGLTIRFVNGNLIISGDNGAGEDNWNGTWKKI